MNKEKTSKEAVNSALRKTDVNSNTAKPILQDSFTTERHPKSKEKFYVTYHKSEDDWRKRVLTKKEFENLEDAIDFWHLVTNNHLGETILTREQI